MAGAVAVAGGAALWAYGLSYLQPLTEPAESAGNNSYWVRDVRWAAMVAVIGLLFALARGDRRTGFVLLGALAGWTAADLALDRAGLAHPVPVVIGAALLGAGAAIAVSRVEARPNRRFLLTVGAVCAASAPIAAFLESPTDVEPELAPARLAAALLLTLAALACGLAVAPQRSPSRTGAAVAVFAGLGVVFAAGNLFLSLACGGALLAAVWALSRPWPGWTQTLGVMVATVLAYPFLAFAGLSMQVLLSPGDPLTALAGSPAVNPADSDVIYLFTGVLTGLLFAGIARIGVELRPVPVLR